jgi:hypothetical protein
MFSLKWLHGVDLKKSLLDKKMLIADALVLEACNKSI